MVRRTAVGTSAVRPYPRASIAAARDTERSSAPSRTGSPTCTRPRTPLSGRPRSRRAARSRRTSAIRCGAKVSATTTATPSSYRAPGSDFSRRDGLARAFAAPTQISSAASRSASYRAKARPSAVTRPPRRMPWAQSGSGTSGSVNRMWVPGIGEPRTIAKASRSTSTAAASFTKAP